MERKFIVVDSKCENRFCGMNTKVFWILSEKEFQFPVNTDICCNLKDDIEFDLN